MLLKMIYQNKSFSKDVIIKEKMSESFKHFRLLQGDRRRKFLAKFVHRIESLFAVGGIAASSAWVDIKGVLKGNDIHWVYCTPSMTMGELTGYPASFIAQFFAEGKIGGIGILPPEALAKNAPELFFNELKERNINMIRDEKEL